MKQKWQHARSCVDDEGKIECVCNMAEFQAAEREQYEREGLAADSQAAEEAEQVFDAMAHATGDNFGGEPF